MTIRNASSSSEDEDESYAPNDKFLPDAKKIKCSPKDLIILVGEEKHEYNCHSIVMANQSDFIDAVLVSPMRESETRIIALPDITPATWGLMMQILNSPKLPTTVQVDHLLLAAEKFDRYQFINGFTICDAHIARVLKSLSSLFYMNPNQGWSMTIWIEFSLRCINLPLEDSKATIITFFRKALNVSPNNGSYYGGLVFNEEQLKRLAPMIAEENILGDRWTKEEILCPLFAKHYLTTSMKKYEEKRFGSVRVLTVNLNLMISPTQIVTLVTLQNTPNTNTYFGYLHGPYWTAGLQGFQVGLGKDHYHGDWIIGIPRTPNDCTVWNNVLWRAPNSLHLASAPPESPWIKVDNNVPVGSLTVIPLWVSVCPVGVAG